MFVLFLYGFFSCFFNLLVKSFFFCVEIGLYGKENFNIKPLKYRINEESFFFQLGKDNIQDGTFGAFKHVGEQGNSAFGLTFALPPIKNSVFLDGVNSLSYLHKHEKYKINYSM